MPQCCWLCTSYNSVLWTLTCFVCQWLWMFFLCILASLASPYHFCFHYSLSKLISSGTSFIPMAIPMWIINLHLIPWYQNIFLINHYDLNSIWLKIYTSSFSYLLTKIYSSSFLIFHLSQGVQWFIYRIL